MIEKICFYENVLLFLYYMNLPEHISKCNDTWYFNAKTKKYIHKDKIEVFLETYWKFRQGVKSVTAKKKYENKLAENRWFGKD